MYDYTEFSERKLPMQEMTPGYADTRRMTQAVLRSTITAILMAVKIEADRNCIFGHRASEGRVCDLEIGKYGTGIVCLHVQSMILLCL